MLLFVFLGVVTRFMFFTEIAAFFVDTALVVQPVSIGASDFCRSWLLWYLSTTTLCRVSAGLRGCCHPYLLTLTVVAGDPQVIDCSVRSVHMNSDELLLLAVCFVVCVCLCCVFVVSSLFCSLLGVVVSY